jgi:hypothetical protein
MAAPAQADVDNFIQALIDAANAARPAVAPQAAAANVVAPVFALAPGLANANFLNFADSNDVKLFNKGIQPTDVKFDLKEGNLQSFLQAVSDRARLYNWSSILEVPDSTQVNRNLVTHYGRVTLDNCRTHAATYIGNPVRDAQNSLMLYHFLSGSLTEAARLRLTSKTSTPFTVNGNLSGTCFLKIIIGKASVDTMATVLILQQSLVTLDQKIIELGSDIVAFNMFVDQQINALLGRGQICNDLLLHFFKGYANASDEKFVTYIEGKREEYEDGEPITAEDLMQSALNRYELRMQMGTWCAADKKTQRIVALEAELKILQANSATVPSKAKREDFAWKKIKPKKGDPTTKTVNKKVYHWCVKHNLWTIHSADKCYLTHPKKPSESDASDDTKSDQQDALTLSKALKAIVDANDDDGDDE